MAAPQATLTGLRREVKDLLTDAGLRGTDTAGRNWTPPYSLVSWGSPVLETGSTFGSHIVRLDVAVVVKPGSNSVSADALDADLNKAIFALVDGGWTIDRVEEPFLLENQNGALAIELSISAEIKLIKE